MRDYMQGSGNVPQKTQCERRLLTRLITKRRFSSTVPTFGYGQLSKQLTTSRMVKQRKFSILLAFFADKKGIEN